MGHIYFLIIISFLFLVIYTLIQILLYILKSPLLRGYSPLKSIIYILITSFHK